MIAWNVEDNTQQEAYSNREQLAWIKQTTKFDMG